MKIAMQSYKRLPGISVNSARGTLVILHGWGMAPEFMETLAEDFADYEVKLLTMPGYEYADNGEKGRYSFSELVESMAETLMEANYKSLILVGWSLGGMVFTELANRYPAMVDKLVLISSSPQFERKDNWACGIEPEVLDTFSSEMMKDFDKTLKRFLSLQVKGSSDEKNLIRSLREIHSSRTVPSQACLESGLAILKNTDLREPLSELQVPVLWIGGDRDMIVPACVADAVAQLNPRIEKHLIHKAGHIPFLSHREEFNQVMKSFIYD